MKDNIKKPNFFIIGAPKCGTTSLRHYLVSHPDIFFSRLKEPNYFNKDLFNKYTFFSTEKRYLKTCFSKTIKYKIVGEGSAMYLYSKKAIPNILKFNPEAKFVVMIRDPIEMFYSLFSMLHATLAEDMEDPRIAWELQKERKMGNFIPRGSVYPQFLQYGEICKLGEQIERLFKNVSKKENIKIIEFGDFKKNTQKIYEEVLVFLNLENDNKTDFSVYNKNRDFKNKKIVEIMCFLRQSRFNKFMKNRGIKHWPVTSKIYNWNSKEVIRKPLNEDFKKELRDYFRKDVEKLSKLINKDLSHWLN